MNKEGKVNTSDCEHLIQVAGGKPCTFHRAFDLVLDKTTALEEIIALGFKRILTSGGENSVEEGLSVLLELLDKAKERIIILPGGGLKLQDITQLSKDGKLKEIHVSCKKFRPSSMQGSIEHLKLSQVEETEGMVLTMDPELMKEVVGFLRAL
ncbi:copper homeostasis protein CutC [Cyclobacterium qasimii]|uniref:Copper homeostasis protein cutC homolog n=1 Tax=Cyclobacterium qasimii M12-11B TaxID=641524 RepID=S7WRV1_9BACT|nr:copper homeostasis protein CutC [Cyclobacterium qasimii]EPR66823.1 Cytoplasmic copper homeostasis protein cutC [Cyclobacterium qasimii M12-11B]